MGASQRHIRRRHTLGLAGGTIETVGPLDAATVGALRRVPLAAPPHTVHPLSIHRLDNRLRSLSFATVRFSAFSASRRGKSDGGERRRPCQQGLISPWSQVRIPPPPEQYAFLMTGEQRTPSPRGGRESSRATSNARSVALASWTVRPSGTILSTVVTPDTHGSSRRM